MSDRRRRHRATLPFDKVQPSQGGQPGGFAPNQLSGLAAWYRFGLGITSAINAVSQWNDQSGNGRHLKQSTGASQPALQADGSILFDGVNDYLKCDLFTFNQPETIYILFKQVSWNATYIFDGGNSDSGLLAQFNASPELIVYSGALPRLSVTPNLAIGTYGVISVVFNGASSGVQLNNNTQATGNTGSSNMGGFTLGAQGAFANFGNIQVKEVVLYSDAHNSATRALVIAYLASVGGLSI